jgi:hypothetical protein
MPSKDVKKPRSKKIETSVVVALIALLGTLVTALFGSPVLIELIKNKSTPSALSTQVQSIPQSSSSIPASPVSSLSGGNGDCLQQYFADIDPTRQISIEVGENARDYDFSSQDISNQNFIGPLGIRLTQNGNMIGALSFLLFLDSRLFKITSVVDSSCQAVTEYANATRGGDKNAIPNSDTLTIQLAEGLFSLIFQYSGTEMIRFNFQQIR